MDREFHAIIVDKSQKDITLFQDLNVISKKFDEDWILYKISVQEEDLKAIVNRIQKNMVNNSWYFHFYNENGSRLVIVFKEKIFETDNNKKNWKDAILYGESLNIQKEQLDFFPNTFLEETY